MLTNNSILGATVTVQAPAGISITPTSGIAPLTVTGSVTGTQPAGAGAYNWNFGDGSAISMNPDSAPMQHTYTKPGTYTVSVAILNQSGAVIQTLSGLGVLSTSTWLYGAVAAVAGYFLFFRRKRRS